MEVRLFGDLEVIERGVPRPVRGPKQRAQLALLALQQGGPLSGDRLIDTLWGDDTPGNPANALQALVAQLRRVLGSDAILTSDAGYALKVRPEDVDIFRFERMVVEARRSAGEGKAAAASSLLAEALSFSRGEPLAEFAYAGFADGERARVAELVLLAMEVRAEAELALGRHEGLVGDLDALCRQYPLRERLWELLILALYRAGRQADALRAYGEARTRLVDELGIEPGFDGLSRHGLSFVVGKSEAPRQAARNHNQLQPTTPAASWTNVALGARVTLVTATDRRGRFQFHLPLRLLGRRVTTPTP
jgi:DNA-binding SARP family transcriptional activator